MSKVDLHIHSNASDGELEPSEVIARAAAAGLHTVALTDHDTMEGCPAAVAAGQEHGVRVILGCEFSAGARWGEIHLLGYFLPEDDRVLNGFLDEQRAMRLRRARTIVERLRCVGAAVDVKDVLNEAMGAAVGRPHVARVLVEAGVAADMHDAFNRYLGPGRPAFVPKVLPSVERVTGLVRTVCGVTSAAHLRSRATRGILEELNAAGVDAVEVVHPAHDKSTEERIDRLADVVGLLRTGGSDWHGVETNEQNQEPLGSVDVPESWLEGVENLHRERLAATHVAA